jgi:hypothetical protein
MQIGRVHESVKFAVRERFHRNNLTTKHTKHTKEFTGKSARGLGAVQNASRPPSIKQTHQHL